MPLTNMWCAQTMKLMRPMHDEREDGERVGEEGLAREDRHDLEDRAQARQRP